MYKIQVRAGLVLGLLLALGVAGCGGDGDDGVATAGGDGTSSASADPGGGTNQEQALRYADCMRENGVPNFPDPDAQGRFSINMNELGVDESTVQAAEDECEQYLPGGGEPEEEIDPEELERIRAYSQCMRDNGVPNFPDPSAEGGLGIDGDQLGMDMSDPRFKAAEQACNDILPGQGATHAETAGGAA